MMIKVLPQQRKFLKLLLNMSGCGAFELTSDDLQLIETAISRNKYSEDQKSRLERLRQRWYGPRDNEIF